MVIQKAVLFSAYVAVLLSVWMRCSSTAQETNSSGYIWKTGPWGKCQGNDCGLGGVQSRSVWCVHSEGWNTIQTNCNQNEKPVTQRHCFKVCDGHRHLFEWNIGEWSMCGRSQEDIPTITSETCGSGALGTHNRSVACIVKSRNILIEHKDGIVDDSFCEQFSPKPVRSDSCLVPCPQDCVVSHFTDWRECTRTCGNGTQTKTRRVIVPPLYEGKPCPPLMKTRHCKGLPTCVKKLKSTYRIKIGPWGSCKPMEKDGTNTSLTAVNQPVIGYQTRQVTCIQGDGQNVYTRLCFLNEQDIPTYRACVISQDCQVISWSEWSPCSQTCSTEVDMTVGFRTRYRNVTALPFGDGVRCPHLQEQQQCTANADGAIVLCPRYKWHVSAWEECQSDYLISKQDKKQLNINDTLCGGGLQSREVFCVQENDTNYRPVDTWLCSPPQPSYMKECDVPCPQDCILSEWSEWGMCSVKNCFEGDVRKQKGQRSRSRKVIQHPLHHGLPCSPLVESRSCEEPICFYWFIGEASRCMIERANKKCGRGKILRPVFCVDVDGEEVDKELCDLVGPRPWREMNCHVPCPDDCVVAEWTSWTECSKDCVQKNETTGLQTRYRNILAYNAPDGKACPKKEELKEERKCNEDSCNAFTWRSGPWGDCLEDSTPTNSTVVIDLEDGMCGHGMKSRLVYCSKADGDKQMPDRKCLKSAKPDSEKPCQVPCATDCIVTKFSKWTPCPVTCKPGEELITKQNRRRYILQHGTPSGQECPDTLYEERDCENLPVCYSYHWVMSNWNECILPYDERSGGEPDEERRCGDGLQTRDISCLRDDGMTVNMNLCLKYAEAMPVFVQTCRIHCPEDCVMSSWSKFGKCTMECVGQRTRKRRLVGPSRRREDCQNTRLYPDSESEICSCPAYTLVPIGEWSDCLLPTQSQDHYAGDIVKETMDKGCGEGLRFKRVVCIDQNKKIVAKSYCGLEYGVEFMEEFCEIPCPMDCKLSGWTAWTECSKSCGTGMKTRYQYLKERSHNGGRQCSHIDDNNKVEQKVPCYSDCSRYVWVAEHWKECEIYTVVGDNCGRGMQLRTVKCVLQQADKEELIVDESYCDKAEQPYGARSCIVPCPGDCVVSYWTDWSLCSHPCDTTDYRSRLRYIARYGKSEDSICQSLNETEPCMDSISCFDYEWSISDRGTCQLPDSALCGKGTKRRELDCVRSDDRSVPLEKCQEFATNHKPKHRLEDCHVECPMDCQMSTWSLWSKCSHTCGYEGVTFRNRHVVREPNEFGRQCPTNMTQHKPCVLEPCYHWTISEWSSCKVEEGDCGCGIRKRNVTCQQTDGTNVDHDYCYGNKDYHSNQAVMQKGFEMMQMEQDCVQPCPGECKTSSWSDWSPCHQTCIDGKPVDNIPSIQTRSKAALTPYSMKEEHCPADIWETRPCQGGSCFEYQWQVSGWDSNGFRDVWCQRSDNINVTGGCNEWIRPSSEHKCHPECTMSHSFCTETSVCACEDKYLESYDVNGFLQVCLPKEGWEDNAISQEEEDTEMYKEGTYNYATDSNTIKDLESSEFKTKSKEGLVEMWLYGAISAGVVFLILIIVITYILCRITRKKAAKRRLQLEKERYWDTSAKKRYNGDIDL
ncbi:thrombospondin type-1 domain-containing protein 7A-like [Glandiceps talaboti]